MRWNKSMGGIPSSPPLKPCFWWIPLRGSPSASFPHSMPTPASLAGCVLASALGPFSNLVCELKKHPEVGSIVCVSSRNFGRTHRLFPRLFLKYITCSGLSEQLPLNPKKLKPLGDGWDLTKLPKFPKPDSLMCSEFFGEELT